MTSVFLFLPLLVHSTEEEEEDSGRNNGKKRALCVILFFRRVDFLVTLKKNNKTFLNSFSG